MTDTDTITEPATIAIPVRYLQILYANATGFQHLSETERVAFNWTFAELEKQPKDERWPE